VQLLAVLALTTTVGVWTALAQSESNMEHNAQCVEQLRMPAYPRLANQANISGSFTPIVSLAPDGSIQDTRFEMADATPVAKRLLTQAIDQALRASLFRKNCEGKPVRLVFNFVLSEQLDTTNLPQTVSFGYPNRFWISVPPKTIQP
jgi:hypothetical protein